MQSRSAKSRGGWRAAGFIAAAGLVAAATLAALTLGPNLAAPAATTGAAPGAASASAAAGSASALSSAQLAGQRVVYSYGGRTPPARLLWLISHGQAAGVVFFGRNITGHAQIRGVIAKLERANAAATNPVRAPLLLMTDQEGGQVRRLSGAPRLSQKQIGQAPDPEAAARSAGTGAAHNLAGVGMNVNLAPVLDVYRSAGDFIDQYGRSYSSNPRTVAALGRDFITAQQRAGVAAAAKHFPGLGAAARAQNTDLRPVTLRQSLKTLRSVDELPYTTAVAAGVRLVMVSWATYPALDASRPAGLSATVVKGELRQRLGFKGVTVTDALEAGALARFGSFSRRSVLAARAGMDLILCSAGQVSQGEQASAALRAAYLDGTLDKVAFTAAAGRVDALRRALAN